MFWVVVAYGNYSHVFVVFDQSLDQRKFIFVHILCFVYYKDAFCYATLFDVAVFNHVCGVANHIQRTFQCACLAKQVKAV